MISPFPRPPSLLKPKPKRREKRRKVTLIAGLVCPESVVFSADTEASGFYRKSSVHKIMDSGREGGKTTPCSIVVSGAGNETFATYAAQEIISQTATLQTLQSVKDCITKILKGMFETNIPLHPGDDDDKAFQLLIGIKAPDQNKALLFSSEGVTLVRRDTFHVWGTGSLIDFVLDQTYSPSIQTEDAISICISMLQLAKKYVGGVGDSTHISVLHSNGQIDYKPVWETTTEESICEEFSHLTGMFLPKLLKTQGGDSDLTYAKHLTEFIAQIGRLRTRKKEQDEQWKEVWNMLAGKAKKDEPPAQK